VSNPIRFPPFPAPTLPQFFPSLISADLLNLEKTLKDLDPHCDGYHIDIMDDHFVPNLTWGPAFVQKNIRKNSLVFTYSF
jgi:pentose-5-phosphate-3-epimerase